MTLQDWDPIASRLRSITFYAQRIQQEVANLRVRPEWKTMAEHEIDRAITALTEAKAKYHSKPVE